MRGMSSLAWMCLLFRKGSTPGIGWLIFLIRDHIVAALIRGLECRNDVIGYVIHIASGFYPDKFCGQKVLVVVVLSIVGI
jgi:hypothetical protein